MYAISGNDVLQKPNLEHVKFALPKLADKGSSSKCFKYLPDRVCMLHNQIQQDEDVNDVAKAKPIKKVFQNVITECLKNSRGIGQAKAHIQVIRVFMACIEGRLQFITLLDTNEVVSPEKVKLSEDFCEPGAVNEC